MKIRISLMGGFEEKTHQDYLRHLCQGRVWRWRWQTFLPPFFSNLMMVEVFLFTFHCCRLVKLQNNFSELQLCATCCFAGSGKRVNATGRDAGKKNVCCATSVVCSRLTSLHQMSCSTDMKDTIPTKAELLLCRINIMGSIYRSGMRRRWAIDLCKLIYYNLSG